MTAASEDVVGIAKGLTETQRRALVRGDGSLQIMRAMVGKGLMYLRIDSPDGKWGFIEPTNLGEQARASTSDQGEK